MTFDLVVTISMHFYERCQTKRDVWNFRFEKNLRYVCPPGDEGLGYFLGFKVLNVNIFGGFQKTEYFFWGGGYEEYMDL